MGMKILMLLILLFPGLKVVDYAYVRSVELDSKPDSVTSSNLPTHTDVYMHFRSNGITIEEQKIKPSSRGKWIAEGLVVSLVVLTVVGLVRGRSR